VLLTESVRRGGSTGSPAFDEAVTIVLARDDDASARAAVAVGGADRGTMRTDVRFIGHDRLATVAEQTAELAEWAGRFRQRYVSG
jgi:hypothetical protein